MNIIYMLLAISVFVALIFFVLFIISVKKGQYDDTYTPSVRMLFDDELVKEGPSVKCKTSDKHSTNPKTISAHEQE
ncbi:cytochrome oxidase maturation protein, cbb3-type [Aequorivita sublithincola DSM 14238]|uniref:Cytochrome oxidase maturation protein, cbb3-type n=1 Tax=Aequorivita sublithincola (strain DSM 14238 / LMG 21431 / ACAM 643 / 9-3) TaxID=746697 RepID=I3YRN0_AEQSU|nr:cbb3-type cytochrome oxidase assembly protein CcoS [Aequorivita sublithincola]AFL79648.1 cytochrome oxidase maturation protein, cbb3-type [Aequorivita sublithincola DSM 14238]